MQTDPVCRMQVEPERAAARAEHRGTTYYFCSQGCHKAFIADPEKYAGEGAPAAGHGAGHQHHG
jgi:Cu+-exporting ATPase